MAWYYPPSWSCCYNETLADKIMAWVIAASAVTLGAICVVCIVMIFVIAFSPSPIPTMQECIDAGGKYEEYYKPGSGFTSGRTIKSCEAI